MEPKVKRRRILMGLLAAGLAAAALPAFAAFDAGAVLGDIGAARKKPVAAPPPGVMAATLSPTDVLADQIRRAGKEEDASFRLLATCEGRFGTLQRTLERQVSRAETISLVGGIVGVLGAVATCPHCAALGAGLAGLANPLQQTFRANGDTPQDTKDQLDKLSAKIESELAAYRQLPAAVPGDAAFEANLRARLDALFTLTASCKFYSTSAAAAAGAPATQP
jgi:hypothetical protein